MSETDMPVGTPDGSLPKIVLIAATVFAYIAILDFLRSVKRLYRRVAESQKDSD